MSRAAMITVAVESVVAVATVVAIADSADRRLD